MLAVSILITLLPRITLGASAIFIRSNIWRHCAGAVACIAGLWFGAAEAQVFEGPRVALVIGNSAYEQVGVLNNPRNDAAAISNALRALDFTVIERTDVGREEVFDALREFSAALTPGSLALFFYAGHGVQIDGVNYIVPVDAHFNAGVSPDLVAVSAADIMGIMEASGAELSVMILDACRDNPFPELEAAADRGLAPMEAGTGQTLIAYATAPGSVADDGNGVHSPYTQALLQVIREPGLEIGLIFRKVGRLVRESTGGAQIPWFSGTMEDEFFLTPPNAPPDAATSDVLAWQSIQQIADPAPRADALRHYLNRFPDGRFAMLAVLQLRDLGAAGAAMEEGETVSRTVSPEQLVVEEREMSLFERQRIQQALKLVDLYYGEIDGVFGPGTREAIRRFQLGLSAAATGYLTHEQQLGLAVAAADQAAQRAYEVATEARAARQRALEIAAAGGAISGSFSAGAYTGEPLMGEGASYGVLGLAAGDVFAGEFQQGRAILGVRSFANGDTYYGALRDGLPHGFGVYQFAAGGEIAGQWDAGVVDGYAISSDYDGRRIAGAWRQNMPDGYGVAQMPDGALARGLWTGGELADAL
jgi:peptidoglycan hydrolase-like protein with peptidoglycan-binding domain